MSTIWIKICGITRNSDALAAVGFGADALGLVFYPPSPRAVAAEQGPAILDAVPQTMEVYGLFVNPERSDVEQAIATSGINRLQFHGEEDPEFCASFGLPYMKAIRVSGEEDLQAVIATHPLAQSILLDSFHRQLPGGTGQQFDWSLAAGLQQSMTQPLILAGGLRPDNVAQAIAQVEPAGIDVSSGVESAPGIKDPEKIKALIEEARRVRH